MIASKYGQILACLPDEGFRILRGGAGSAGIATEQIKVSIFVIQKLQVSQHVANQRQHMADIKKDIGTARRILWTNEVGCYLT